MRPDLTKYLEARQWLADPTCFRPFVLRALGFPSCPSAREVAKARRKALDWAKAAPARAVASTGQTHLAEEQLAAAGGKPLRALKGKIATIPILGPVGQRMSSELMKAGGTSMEDIAAALDACLADRSVDGIVLEWHSPGGESYGTEELASKIRDARGQKKIYSLCNSLMCSAAFWIGTSAEQVMITPGGDCGSVGVYCLHADQSEADKEAGVKVSFIGTPEAKTEGNSHEPLSADALAYIRQQVDETYAKFVAGVAKNRGVSPEQVRTRFGQGRVVSAQRAVDAGMCDRVMGYDQLMSRLTGGGSGVASASRQGASIDMLRRRLAQVRCKESLHLTEGR